MHYIYIHTRLYLLHIYIYTLDYIYMCIRRTYYVPQIYIAVFPSFFILGVLIHSSQLPPSPQDRGQKIYTLQLVYTIIYIQTYTYYFIYTQIIFICIIVYIYIHIVITFKSMYNYVFEYYNIMFNLRPRQSPRCLWSICDRPFVVKL